MHAMPPEAACRLGAYPFSFGAFVRSAGASRLSLQLVFGIGGWHRDCSCSLGVPSLQRGLLACKLPGQFMPGAVCTAKARLDLLVARSERDKRRNQHAITRSVSRCLFT